MYNKIKSLARPLKERIDAIISSNKIRNAQTKRILLGAAKDRQKGWISTDYYVLDVTSNSDWCRLFDPNSIDALCAEHLWEHLTSKEGLQAARNAHFFLRPGARLRIAVPDGLNPSDEYLEWVRPGGIGPGADDHKVLYNYETISELGRRAGFEVTLLEYFDKVGKFRKVNWDSCHGHIKRSLRFDERNKGGKLKYTSIIVDFVKPNN